MNPIEIPAYNPGPLTGAGNRTWLLPGRLPTLIDAGTGEPRHLDDLARALDGARLHQVVVTHGHTDHASGIGPLLARMPDVRRRKMAWPERDGRSSVIWEPLADGQIVDAGDVSLEVVHTPGHAPDHVCLWHRESRTLFGGDLAIEGTTVWIPSSSQGDLTDYLASLRRVIALDPVRIYPAHGPTIEDPVALLQRYLAHRHDRELEVLGALAAGGGDADRLVAAIYPTLSAGMQRFARESVVAHLVKLEREGLARRHGERWEAVPAS